MAFPVVNPPAAFDLYNLESARARARTIYRERYILYREKTIYKGKGGRLGKRIYNLEEIYSL